LRPGAVVQVIKRNRIGQKVGIARIIVELSIPQLVPMFNFPLRETAGKLGISCTALKRNNLVSHRFNSLRGCILIETLQSV
jgi:hypothetical protein